LHSRKSNEFNVYKMETYCKRNIFTPNLFISVRFNSQYITLLSWQLYDKGTGFYFIHQNQRELTMRQQGFDFRGLSELVSKHANSLL